MRQLNFRVRVSLSEIPNMTTAHYDSVTFNARFTYFLDYYAIVSMKREKQRQRDRETYRQKQRDYCHIQFGDR